MDNSFYVYSFLREDNTPYYIGKGSGRRAFSNQRIVPKPKNKNLIKILSCNLNEEDAFILESKLISEYGRKNNGTGILRNLTDGGKGGTVGRICSEKTKQKMSEILKGRPSKLKGIKKTPHTYNSKKLISNANKGRVFWYKEGICKKSKECPGEGWVRGRGPEASKFGVENSSFGKKRSEKTRNLLSEKAKLRKKVLCNHCNILCNASNFKRWHGENCKKAKNEY
jgi:hypothetical protein